MNDADRDTLMRMAAFEHLRRLSEAHDHLTTNDLQSGFVFESARFPLINPQRGIFKPKEMRFLLSIRTVFPRPGGRVWYDDQRDVHRQIFEGDETVDSSRPPVPAFQGCGLRCEMYAGHELFACDAKTIQGPLGQRYGRR